MRRQFQLSSALMTAMMVTASIGVLALATAALLSLQREGQSTLTAGLDTYDRLRAIVAFEPDLSRMEKSRSLPVNEEALLGNGTPAELSARLLALLNQMAAERGLQVLRTSGLPPLQSGAVTLIGAELELAGQTAQVYAMLQQIAVTKPYLSVDRLSVRAEAAASADEPQDSPISVALRVYGATRAAVMTPPPPSP